MTNDDVPSSVSPDTPDTDAPAQVSRPRVRRRPRSGPEARERRRRLWWYGLLIVSGVLMVNAVVGEKGYLATIQAQREQQQVADALREVRAENLRLREAARRLREDPKALEEAARQDLGLIRPGETLITLRDKTRD